MHLSEAYDSRRRTAALQPNGVIPSSSFKTAKFHFQVSRQHNSLVILLCTNMRLRGTWLQRLCYVSFLSCLLDFIDNDFFLLSLYVQA
ncbi:hypothetical protein FOCC_FOCC002441 [Frankliniella occidentalis]|nr:hypothetical protein FOCC_FOCC002441 [Frankliniella occidentalis]